MFNIFKKKPAEDVTSAPEAVPVIADEVTTEAKIELTWGQRLKQGLAKTRQQLSGQLNSLFGGGKIDAETYDELETITHVGHRRGCYSKIAG